MLGFCKLGYIYHILYRGKSGGKKHDRFIKVSSHQIFDDLPNFILYISHSHTLVDFKQTESRMLIGIIFKLISKKFLEGCTGTFSKLLTLASSYGLFA